MTIMLGKVEGSRKWGRPHMSWINSIKEGISLKELSRAVRTGPCIHHPFTVLQRIGADLAACNIYLRLFHTKGKGKSRYLSTISWQSLVEGCSQRALIFWHFQPVVCLDWVATGGQRKLLDKKIKALADGSQAVIRRNVKCEEISDISGFWVLRWQGCSLYMSFGYVSQSISLMVRLCDTKAEAERTRQRCGGLTARRGWKEVVSAMPKPEDRSRNLRAI